MPQVSNFHTNSTPNYQTLAGAESASTSNSSTTRHFGSFVRKLIPFRSVPSRSVPSRVVSSHSEERRSLLSPDTSSVQAPEEPATKELVLENEPVVNPAKCLESTHIARRCFIENYENVKKIYLFMSYWLEYPMPEQKNTSMYGIATDFLTLLQRHGLQRAHTFEASRMKWENLDAKQIKEHTTKVKEFFADTFEGVATPECIKDAISETLRVYFEPTRNLISSEDRADINKLVSIYLTVAYYTMQAALSQSYVNIDAAEWIKKACVANSRELECLFLPRTTSADVYVTGHKYYPLFQELNVAIQDAKAAYMSVHAYCMQVIVFNFIQKFLPNIQSTARDKMAKLLLRHPEQSLHNVMVPIVEISIVTDSHTPFFNFKLLIDMKAAHPGAKLRLSMRAYTDRLHLQRLNSITAKTEVNTADGTIVSFTGRISDDAVGHSVQKLQEKTAVSYVLFNRITELFRPSK